MRAMVVAGGLSLGNLLFGRSRWLAASAFAVVALAELLGGPTVPVGDFPVNTPYLGLDFFVLDLLGSAFVFAFIEKLFPLRADQPVFRAEWQNDLMHFFVNHLIVGLILFVVNRVVHGAFGWTSGTSLQDQ